MRSLVQFVLLIMVLVAVQSFDRNAAQEPAQWPGYQIEYYDWATCHYPWTDPGDIACVSPANGVVAGYIPFLAQIFVDRPEADFKPAFRRGKTLYEMQHVCGGALVAPEWVLTAAHCITPEDIGKNYKVRLGIDNISDLSDGFIFDIEEVVLHPDYQSLRGGDIALVRIAPRRDVRINNAPALDERPFGLAGEMELRRNGPQRDISFINFARPAGTPVSRMPWGFEKVTIYGWGKTEDVNGEAPAPQTYKVSLTVLPNEFCARIDGYDKEKVPDSVFCAVHPERKTCRGDSGGPVVDATGALIGIVSWGKNRCIGDGLPGVYTRVASYSAWVDEKIAVSLKTRLAGANGGTPSQRRQP